MKIALCYFTVLLCLVSGCGGDPDSPSTNELVALNIIQKYNLHIEGKPQTDDFTLPQEFNDANWGLKEIVCQQAGCDLTPFAGQTVSSVRYSILEKYDGEPLYLWILIKENACICAYTSVREGSGLVPGVFPVNESIVGIWVWYGTSGGLAGVNETPGNTGETRKVVFEDNGNVTFYTNGEVTLSSTYTSATEKTIMAEDPLPVVKVEGISFIYAYSFPSVDKLKLQENVVDGFTFEYWKEWPRGKKWRSGR